MSALDMLESPQTLGKEMFKVYTEKNKPCVNIIIWNIMKENFKNLLVSHFFIFMDY